MADIFVSYARVDRERVAPLVELLESRGWSVWWDREIGPGAAFRKVIEAEIAAARCVVVVWTAASVDSDWVNAEATEGLSRRVLIPVRLEDVELPLVFRQTQACDLFDWPRRQDRAEIDRLLGAVESSVGVGSAAAPREPTGGVGAAPEAPPASNTRMRRFAPLLATAGIVLLAALYLVLDRSDAPSVPVDTAKTAEAQASAEAARAASASTATSTPTIVVEAVDGTELDLAREVRELLGRAAGLQVLPATYADGVSPERPAFRLRAALRDEALAVSLFDEVRGATRTNFRVDVAATGLQGAARRIADRVLREFDLEPGAVPPPVDDEVFIEYLALRSRYGFAADAEGRAALIDGLEDVVRAAPRFAEAHAALCVAHIREYRLVLDAEAYERAERRCARATRLDRENPWVATALGDLYLEGGQLDAAAERYEAALEISPSLTEALSGLARTRAAQDDPDAAEALLFRAQELEPDNWSHYAVQAVLYFDAGRFEAAAEQYELAAPLSRNSASMLNDLGSAYFMQEDYPAAIDAWERVVAEAPSSLAWSNIGSARFFDGDFAGALDAYEAALALSDNDFRMWLNAGDAARLVDSVDARRYFEKAAALADAARTVNPEADDVRSALLLAQASLGNAAAAREEIAVLLAQDSVGLYALYDVAVAQVRLGEQAAATRTLADLIAQGYPRELLLKDVNFSETEVP